VTEYVSKNAFGNRKKNILHDQLQCIRIAVDRFFFFKETLSLDRFLILAFVPDRFFIGGIEKLVVKIALGVKFHF